MKLRMTALALALCLGLGLCACAPAEQALPPFDVEGTAQALLDCGGYTDTDDMQPPLDPAVLFDGLDAATVTAGAAYSSTYTAELAVVIVFTDEAAATAGLAVLEEYLSSQTKAEESYRPAEAAKLQKAIAEQRGATLVLAVAEDAAAARAAIDGWNG